MVISLVLVVSVKVICFLLCLFCLAEEVLSRKSNLLVSSKKLERTKGPNNIIVPYHILYADDVFIFCKDKVFNIKVIISTLDEYAVISG